VNKFLPIILFSLIPLNGCSAPETEPELSYDPIEVIEYQNCLEVFRSTYGSRVEQFCADKKPVLK